MSRAQVDINLKGTDPQMQFWAAEERYRAFVGGVGSGKTFAGCVEVLRQPAKTRGAIIAPTYRMLQDATLQTFLEMARKADIIREWRRSDMLMTLENGTEILFRSADDPDKLRGPNLGWFWLDEAAMMPELVFDLMIGRLRLNPGRGWVTTTPKGMNWLYNLFGKGREGYSLTQCSTRSNIFLPKHFSGTLMEKYKGVFLEQEEGGKFVEWVDAPAYDSFSSVRNVKKGIRSRYQSTLPVFLACDFNARVMIWGVVQIIENQPMVLTEIAMVGSSPRPPSIPRMVSKFRLQFPDHAGGVVIYGDATGAALAAQTGRTTYDILLDAFKNYSCSVDMMVPKANPAVANRVRAMNNVLDGAGCWLPLVMDEDETPFIQRDFSNVEWDESGMRIKQITDKLDERSTLTHASDGLGYWASMDAPFASIEAEVEKTDNQTDYDFPQVEYDGLAVGGF